MKRKIEIGLVLIALFWLLNCISASAQKVYQTGPFKPQLKKETNITIEGELCCKWQANGFNWAALNKCTEKVILLIPDVETWTGLKDSVRFESVMPIQTKKYKIRTVWKRL